MLEVDNLIMAACICHMLYCFIASAYILAKVIDKRKE